MYFLSDLSHAQFAQKLEEKKPIDEKVGLLKKGFQLAVGKTPMGTLTRAASLAGIGGSLYGMSKMRKSNTGLLGDPIRRQYRMQQIGKKIKNAITSNTVKDIGKTAVGTVAGGIALNEGRKLYEKKNRKWWEVL